MIMGETLTWLHHVWEYVVPQLRGIEADSLERDVKRTSRNSASMCLNDKAPEKVLKTWERYLHVIRTTEALKRRCVLQRTTIRGWTERMERSKKQLTLVYMFPVRDRCKTLLHPVTHWTARSARQRPAVEGSLSDEFLEAHPHGRVSKPGIALYHGSKQSKQRGKGDRREDVMRSRWTTFWCRQLGRASEAGRQRVSPCPCNLWPPLPLDSHKSATHLTIIARRASSQPRSSSSHACKVSCSSKTQAISPPTPDSGVLLLFCFALMEGLTRA